MYDDSYFSLTGGGGTLNLDVMDNYVGAGGGTVLSGDTSPFASSGSFNWGGAVSGVGALLSLSGIAQQGEAAAGNIFANIKRTERNIEQLERELSDTLSIQARKISRRGGTQKARIGASGVGFSGSPLLVMAETYQRGIEDYEAIEERGKFMIDDAYRQIFDSLDRVDDIAKSMKYAANSAILKGAISVGTAFLGV